MIKTVNYILDLLKIKKHKSLDDVNGHRYGVSAVNFKHILHKINHINLVLFDIYEQVNNIKCLYDYLWT